MDLNFSLPRPLGKWINDTYCVVGTSVTLHDRITSQALIYDIYECDDLLYYIYCRNNGKWQLHLGSFASVDHAIDFLKSRNT